MIFNLKTTYKNQDGHGNSIACLELYMETANVELRNRVRSAIEKALAGPEERDEKLPAIGFGVPYSPPPDLGDA